jgi:hypothetical protein
MLSTCYIYQILAKQKSSRQIFEKSAHFMKVRPVGAELYHEEGRMDRHDEANIRFS